MMSANVAFVEFSQMKDCFSSFVSRSGRMVVITRTLSYSITYEFSRSFEVKGWIIDLYQLRTDST